MRIRQIPILSVLQSSSEVVHLVEGLLRAPSHKSSHLLLVPCIEKAAHQRHILSPNTGKMREDKRMGSDKQDIPSKSVLTSLAASTFAGLSRFGRSEDKREMTLRSCSCESNEREYSRYVRVFEYHSSQSTPKVLSDAWISIVQRDCSMVEGARDQTVRTSRSDIKQILPRVE